MKIPQDKLFIRLKEIVKNTFVNDRRLTQETIKKLNQKYNMPIYKAQDFISLWMVEKYSEFDLFVFADVFGEMKPEFKDLTKEYFTDTEIKTYSASSYDVQKVKLPIRFKCIEIREGQWIGNITTETLKLWDNAMLINYNENTQRVLTRKVNGSTEIWKITINRTAVNEIKALMKNGMYYPDPMTFNIPQSDYENEFGYEPDKMELVIRQVKKFDIIDGYHRLVALRECMEEDSEFSFTMELRITNWTEDQCLQFIYQQDQKTKMTKAESKTYNKQSTANRIVDGLIASRFNVASMIKKNGGQINYTDIATAIDKIWFSKRVINKEERRLLYELPKEIGKKFDLLFADDEANELKLYNYKELYIILYCIKCNISDEEFAKKVREVIKETQEMNVSLTSPYRKFVSALQNIIGVSNIQEPETENDDNVSE